MIIHWSRATRQRSRRLVTPAILFDEKLERMPGVIALERELQAVEAFEWKCGVERLA